MVTKYGNIMPLSDIIISMYGYKMSEQNITPLSDIIIIITIITW